jgi:hypothetical protein
MAAIKGVRDVLRHVLGQSLTENETKTEDAEILADANTVKGTCSTNDNADPVGISEAEVAIQLDAAEIDDKQNDRPMNGAVESVEESVYRNKAEVPSTEPDSKEEEVAKSTISKRKKNGVQTDEAVVEGIHAEGSQTKTIHLARETVESACQQSKEGNAAVGSKIKSKSSKAKKRKRSISAGMARPRLAMPAYNVKDIVETCENGFVPPPFPMILHYLVNPPSLTFFERKLVCITD